MNTRTGSSVLIAVTAAVVLAFGSEARAAVLRVRNNGLDAPGCGTADRPCRSISAAVRGAVDGDRIVVGPGRYGDLNGNGVTDPGDEPYYQDCSCLVHVDKRVTIESEAGAAATMIDGGGADPFLVVLTAEGTVFGKPGKGFTLTSGGMGVHADFLVPRITVAGNHAQGNRFGGFEVGSAGSRVVRNVATQNGNYGFNLYGAVTVSGNVAVGNPIGFEVQGDHMVLSRNLASGNTDAGFQVNFGPHTFTHNSAIGNRGSGLWVGVLYGNTAITKSNFYGNDVSNGCGLLNSTGGTVDARGNFWGAPGGPGDDPADRACNEGSGTTTTSGAADKEIALKIPTLK